MNPEGVSHTSTNIGDIPRGTQNQSLNLAFDRKAPFQLVRSTDVLLKDPSEFDIESGSETWVTNVKISRGRKMQRVWKSLQPDEIKPSPKNIQSSDCCKTNLKTAEEPTGTQEKQDDQIKLDSPIGQLKSLKYQKWFKTPDFTLKPKPNELEQSGDTQILKIQSIIERQSTLTEKSSCSCLTKTKIDPSSFYSVEDVDCSSTTLKSINTNTTISYKPIEDEEDTNKNRLNPPCGTNSELEFLKSKRIKDWITPQNTTDITINPFKQLEKVSESVLLSSQLSSDFKLSSTNTLSEEYVNIKNISRPEGQIQEIILQASKTNLKSSKAENRSQFSAYMGKFIPLPTNPNHEQRPTAGPLLHSVHKIAKNLLTTRNSSKNQQESSKLAGQSTEPETELPDKEIMSSFKDVSFHYQPKDGNVEELTPTGFSINFDYPDEIVSKPSNGNVSTYFPTSRTSLDKISTEIVKVPEFMLEFRRDSKPTNEEMESSKNDIIDYNIDVIKPPTPCAMTSNLSITPLIQSQATFGNTTTSQQAIIDEGINSDNGMSVPSTAADERRRRPRSVRDRPYSDDMSDVDLKIYNENKQSNAISNVADVPQVPNNVTPKITQSSKSSYKSDKIVHSESGGRNKIVCPNAAFRKPNTDENSKSNQYLAHRVPHKGNFWEKVVVSGKVLPCGISTVTTDSNQDILLCKQTSKNKLSSATSSKGSLVAAKSSSKNFILENIEKVKGTFKGQTAALKMPTEERPPLPLPKAGAIKGQVKNNKVKKIPSMPKKKVDKQGKAEVQSDQPDMAQKILKALEVTEGAISAVSPETVPSEKPKAKLQQKPKALTKTKKAEPKDIVTRMSDPYYMRATPSERQIIDEVVKADLDAILERDAERKLADKSTEDSATDSQSTTVMKYSGNHWEQGVQLTPAKQNPLEDPQIKTTGKSKKVTTSMKTKPSKVTGTLPAAGEISGNKKAVPKPKARKQ